MQAQAETWPLAMRDTDTRSSEPADRSVADATRPPRKQGTKRSMEFRLACCITPRVRIVVAPIDPRMGAAMKDESGSVRTSIQGQGCSAHAAA